MWRRPSLRARASCSGPLETVPQARSGIVVPSFKERDERDMMVKMDVGGCVMEAGWEEDGKLYIIVHDASTRLCGYSRQP